MQEGQLITHDVNHSQAATIFVLGLLSVIIPCPLSIMGPIAFYLGKKYRDACIIAGEQPEGLGTAGWVLSIVGSVFFCLYGALLLVYLGIICIYVVIILLVLVAGI